MKIGENRRYKFYCQKCDYKCSKKSHWDQHILTRKHKMDNKDNNRITKIVGYVCPVCSKQYKYASGLSKHKRRCHASKEEEQSKKMVIEITPTQVDSLEKDLENITFKNDVDELRLIMKKLLVQNNQTNEKIDTLKNIVPKIGDTYNNKLSINIYLNEKCKDAMNLTDFVDNINVTLEDLDYTKNHGFVKGISNIFVKQLQDMEPTQRPIHCSDTKRLQFYIKDENKWNRDQKHNKINSTIENVAMLQIKKIKQWEKEHPNYLNNEAQLMEWHSLVHAMMGGDTEEERIKYSSSIKKQLSNTVDMKNELIIK